MTTNRDNGFKIVLKTIDSTKIILMDTKNDLNRKRTSSSENGKEKSKRRRKSRSEKDKKREIDKDKPFPRCLNEKEQLKLHQFDKRKTRNHDKAKDKESLKKFITDKIQEKFRDHTSNEATIVKKIDKIAHVLQEKMPKTQQIIIFPQNCNEKELAASLIHSGVDPDVICISKMSEKKQRIMIKEEVKVEEPKIKLESSEKPKMLRKFRPPVNRKRIRSNSTEKDCKIVETKKTVIELDDSIEEAGKSSEPLPSPMSKLYQINAWFARSQQSWCAKERRVLAKMLTTNGLVATYKCMATSCSYTTVDAGNFKAHLNFHRSQNDLDAFLYFCPYCFFRGDSSSSLAGSSNPVAKLINHYQTYHAFDIAQCGVCFYRSAEAHTTWEHMDTCHSKEPKMIFETLMERRVADKGLERKLQRLKRNVPPLVCTTCQKCFFTCESYENHLNKHCEDAEATEAATRDFKIYNKKKANLQIGLYECLFCRYGSSTRCEC